MGKFAAARRFIWLDLALLAVLALLLGIYGGPSTYHPDSVLEKALRTLDQGGNPRFFNYPALVLYLNGYLYQGWLGLLKSSGVLHGVVSPLAWYLYAVRPGSAVDLPVFGPGQAITLFFSLLGSASTYLAAYRLTRSRAAALAAGLLLVTCLLWATDAHYLTVDTPMTGLGMATVALTLVFIPRKGEPPKALRIWQVIVLGVLGGLTAAAKYNGALVLLAPAIAMFLQYRSKWQWYGHVMLMTAIAGVVFFTANPYILQDSNTFWRDFEYELNHARVGHPGFTTSQAWLFHLQTTLPLAYGWVALALAAGGMLWLLWTRTLSWAEKLGLLMFPMAEFWVVGSSHLAFQRYAIPLLPLVAILAALALHAFTTWVRQGAPRLHLAAFSRRSAEAAGSRRSAEAADSRWSVVGAVLAGMVLAAAVLPNVRNGIQSDELLSRIDTRAYLDVIVREVGLDSSSTPGFAGMYTDRYFNQRFKSSQGDANRASIIVMDSFSHDRWIYDPTTPLTIRRNDFEGYEVIQLSPFTLPKASVPISAHSIYSPYLPDLYDRSLPGPFIEIYLRDSRLAGSLMDACRKYGAPCARLAAQDGYYYQAVFK